MHPTFFLTVEGQKPNWLLGAEDNYSGLQGILYAGPQLKY
jgi:hypothetical protein